LVTTAVFLRNGYHAGKYSMVPGACSVKSLKITKKLKGTNRLDECLRESHAASALSISFTFQFELPLGAKRLAQQFVSCL
jgi:hypothetical protein